MTLRAAATAIAPLTLTNWRDAICGWLGVAYADLGTVAVAEIDRYIDEAHEFISKELGHEPWTKREASISLASGTATFLAAADVRQMIVIVETYAGDTRRVKPTTKEDYLAAWGEGSVAHPWATQKTPLYFLDGMSDANPPVQQWKRVPTPDASVTGTILYRPYFDTLATGSYSELPASCRSMIREKIRQSWALFTSDYEKASAHRSFLRDEIATHLKSDDTDGAWEAPREVELPDWASREMTP